MTKKVYITIKKITKKITLLLKKITIKITMELFKKKITILSKRLLLKDYNYKDARLLNYLIYFSRKMFYDTGPWSLNIKPRIVMLHLVSLWPYLQMLD